MRKFFKFQELLQLVSGQNTKGNNLRTRGLWREGLRHEGLRRSRKSGNSLSDRKLTLEELERRELLSVTNVVLQDAADYANRLTYTNDEGAQSTLWTCGTAEIESSTLLMLQNAQGEAGLRVTGTAESGTLSWQIEGDPEFLSEYWDRYAGNGGDTLNWRGTDSEGNLLSSPKRTFSIYVWDDTNADGILDAGEDYQSFTVSIQRAEITIAVCQPVPGTDTPFDLSEGFNAGYTFWDNRVDAVVLESGIISSDLAEYANTSIGYGAKNLDITKVLPELVKTGTYKTEGIVDISADGTGNLTKWDTVSIYNTFAIDSLSDYLNLLQYNRGIAANPPEYILAEDAQGNESNGTTAALGALSTAGISVGSYERGDIPSGEYDFEYEKMDEYLDTPFGLAHVKGTVPGLVGEALAATDASQSYGAVRGAYNGNAFASIKFPEPDGNGLYSLTDLRDFYETLKKINLTDEDPVRAQIESFILNLSSNPVSDNILYMDFTGHETAVGSVNVITPQYSLDGDESRDYFTCNELLNMFEAWLVTAEDYAPFNVNVTLSEAKYKESYTKSQNNMIFREGADATIQAVYDQLTAGKTAEELLADYDNLVIEKAVEADPEQEEVIRSVNEGMTAADRQQLIMSVQTEILDAADAALAAENQKIVDSVVESMMQSCETGLLPIARQIAAELKDVYSADQIEEIYDDYQNRIIEKAVDANPTLEDDIRAVDQIMTEEQRRAFFDAVQVLLDESAGNPDFTALVSETAAALADEYRAGLTPIVQSLYEAALSVEEIDDIDRQAVVNAAISANPTVIDAIQKVDASLDDLSWAALTVQVWEVAQSRDDVYQEKYDAFTEKYNMENAPAITCRRVVIGGSVEDWKGTDAWSYWTGGAGEPYTYINIPEGGFSQDTVCYVFGLARSGKWIGNYASQVLGLSFGLEYQSGHNQNRDKGTDVWAPIMGGVEYSEDTALVQWSSGDYTWAQSHEDQLTVLARNFVDAEHLDGYRKDDYAGYDKRTETVNTGDIYTATLIDLKSLEAGTTTFGGVIEKNSDVDYFMLEISEEGESYNIAVGGINGLSNLDVRVNLYNADGTLYKAYDPSDTASVNILFDAKPGVYYLAVMGTGLETNDPGVYSDYGSLGQYDIRISKPEIITVSEATEEALRKAVDEANQADPAKDVKIVFDKGVTEIALTGGDLTITRSMTIYSESGVTLKSDGTSRVMTVTGGDVVLTNLTLTGGKVTSTETTIESGAGLLITGGNVTMTGCTVTGNTSAELVIWEGDEPVNDEAEEGDAADGEENAKTFKDVVGGFGGGICVEQDAVLTLNDTVISGNSARTGAGIYNNAGTVVINNGSVSNNVGSEEGAGIYSTAVEVTIDNVKVKVGSVTAEGTVISGNRLANRQMDEETIAYDPLTMTGTLGNARGGGAFIADGTAVFTNVTFSSNSAEGWYSQGAGLYVDAANVTVTDSLISGNAAVGNKARSYNVSGAGAYVNTGSLTLDNVNVRSNYTVSLYTAPEPAADAEGDAAAATVYAAAGAGVFADGTLSVANSTISGNSLVMYTPMAAGCRVMGAGIGGDTGNITISGTNITSNTIEIYGEVAEGAILAGAGAAVSAGNLSISGSTVFLNKFVDNREVPEDVTTTQQKAARLLGIGGGVMSISGSVSVSGSTISNNIAAYGANAAVSGIGGTLTISGSTITQAPQDAEAKEFVCNSVNGGGVYVNGATLTVKGSTISNNYTLGSGAGIYAVDSTVSIIDSSTITGNVTNLHALNEGETGGGAGLWMSGGTLYVNLSYITANTASAMTTFESAQGDLFTNSVVGGGAALSGVSAQFDFAFVRDNTLAVETYDTSTNKSVSAYGGGVYADGATVLTVSDTEISGNSITATAATASGASAVAYGGGIFADNTGTSIDACKITANSVRAEAWNSDEANFDVVQFDAFARGAGFYGSGLITNSLFTQNNTLAIGILNEGSADGAAISDGSAGLTVNNCTITENMAKILYITWDSRVRIKASIADGTPFQRLRTLADYGTYFNTGAAVASTNYDYALTLNNNIIVNNCYSDNDYYMYDYYSASYCGQYQENIVNSEDYSPVYAEAQALKEQYPDASDETILAMLERNSRLSYRSVNTAINSYNLGYNRIIDPDTHVTISRTWIQGWGNMSDSNTTGTEGTFRYDESIPAAENFSGNNIVYDEQCDIGNYINNPNYFIEKVYTEDGVTVIGYNVWLDSAHKYQLVEYNAQDKSHKIYSYSSFGQTINYRQYGPDEAYNYMLFTEAGQFDFQNIDHKAAAGNYRLNQWVCNASYRDQGKEHCYTRYNAAVDTGTLDGIVYDEDGIELMKYDLNHAERVANGETGRGTVVDRGAYEWQHDPGYGKTPTAQNLIKEAITVTTLEDVIADDGVISFREAIANYQKYADVYTAAKAEITFADYIQNGTIQLDQELGSIILNTSISINGDNKISITGLGTNLCDSLTYFEDTVEAKGLFGSIFEMYGTGLTITLKGLDISGGTGTFFLNSTSDLSQNYAVGGAIYSELANSTLNITNTTIHDCWLHGHVYSPSNCEGNAYGGLIYQKSASGSATTINITASTLTRGYISHSMEGFGGGIYAENAVLNLKGAQITDNIVGDNHLSAKGGGIALIDTATDGTVNSILNAGVYVNAGQAVSTVISGNELHSGEFYDEATNGNKEITAYGGGIYLYAQQMISETPRISIVGSYVLNNMANVDIATDEMLGTRNASGGGIYLDIQEYTGKDLPKTGHADLYVANYTAAVVSLVGENVERITPYLYSIAGGISGNTVYATSDKAGVTATGGGISANFAYVTVEGGTISNNTAAIDAGKAETDVVAQGGGIYLKNQSSLTTRGKIAEDENAYEHLFESNVTGNAANATASDTVKAQKAATAQGGGIYIDVQEAMCEAYWASAANLSYTNVSGNSISAKGYFASCYGAGIYAAGSLNLREQTLENVYWSSKDKYSPLYNVEISNNSAAATASDLNGLDAISALVYGGGIFYATVDTDSAPDIYFKNILIEGNSINVSALKTGTEAAGAGVFSDSIYRSVSLVDSMVNNNQVYSNWGGVDPDDLTYSPTFHLYAGGIYTSGNLNLYQSAVSGNLVKSSERGSSGGSNAFGGGIYADGESLTLDRARIMNNTVSNYIADGAGIFDLTTNDLVITASIIGNNAAVGNYALGGGLFSENKSIELTNDNYDGSVFSDSVTAHLTDSLSRSTRFYGNISDGAVPGLESDGGAIHLYNGGENGYLLVRGGTLIYGNKARGNGGGIWTDLVDSVTIEDGSKVYNNTAGYYGGGVFNSGNGEGVLVLQDIEMYGNTAGMAGGALYNGPEIDYSHAKVIGKGSSVSASHVSVYDNTANSYGGGFYIDYADAVEISYSSFTNNTALSRGGAVYNNAGNLSIFNSIFTQNKAAGKNGYGGAVCNLGDAVNAAIISNSVFIGNSAYGGGGAVYNYSYGGLRIAYTDFEDNTAVGTYGVGGAIYNQRGALTLAGDLNKDSEYNVFSRNTAVLDGGAVYNERGAVSVTDYVFTENEAGRFGGAVYNQGKLELMNSEPLTAEFAFNTAGKDGGAVYNTSAGYANSISVNGYSFVNNSAGQSGGAIYSDADAAVSLTGKDFITDPLNYSVFSGNSAGKDGGAVALAAGSLEIFGYDFSRNKAVGNGGALWLGGGTLGASIAGAAMDLMTIDNVPELIEKYADYITVRPILPEEETPETIDIYLLNRMFLNESANGGAVFNLGGAVSFTNYSLERNTAFGNGGAVYSTGDVDMLMDVVYEPESEFSTILGAGDYIGVVDNTAKGYGGGFYVRNGNFSADRYNFMRNSGSDGGALYVSGIASTVNINSGVEMNLTAFENPYAFAENISAGSGGAIYHFGGDMNILFTTLGGNSAEINGGAIYNFGGYEYEANIFYSEIIENSAVSAGAGIYNAGTEQTPGAELLLETVLVADNTLTGDGAQGAGIYNASESLIVRGSTVAGNAAVGTDTFGGGVYVANGTAVFNSSIIALNSATTGNDIYAEKEAIKSRDVILSASYTVSSAEAKELLGSGWDDANCTIYDMSRSTLFVNPAEGDYHLTADSVAVGAGNETVPYDLDGIARTKPYDAGAYSLTAAGGTKYQFVYGETENITVSAGDSFTVAIDHKTRTARGDEAIIPYVTTLSLMIHFDSQSLEFDFNSWYAKNFFASADEDIVDGIYPGENIITLGGTPFTIVKETEETDDGDASTDSYILVSWNESISQVRYWDDYAAYEGVYEHIEKILEAGFTVKNDAKIGTATRINFTASDWTYDYKFFSQSVVVNVSAPSFDIDASGTVDAATDLNLILRYFRHNMRGDALRQNVLSSEYSTRGNDSANPHDLEDYLEKNRSLYDVDGDGTVTETDCTLLERYFAGLRGNALTNGLSIYGTRTTALQIEQYLNPFMKEGKNKSSVDKYQVVWAETGDDGGIGAVAGQSVTVNIDHTLYTENGIQAELEATTLSLRVHYNSDILTFNTSETKLADQYLSDLIASGDIFYAVYRDVNNYDNDESTDTYLLITWNESKTTWWEGNSPMDRIASLVFTVNGEYPDGKKMDASETAIHFTAASVSADYQFSDAGGASISTVGLSIDSGTFDIDNDGKVNTSGDGDLLLRRILAKEVWGDDITSGISSPLTKDETLAYIESHIDNGVLFDLDGDGKVQENDANILVRYLASKGTCTDARLVLGLLNAESTRVVKTASGAIDYDLTGAKIAKYIAQFIPSGSDSVREKLDSPEGFAVATTLETIGGVEEQVASVTANTITVEWDKAEKTSKVESYIIGYCLAEETDAGNWTYVRDVIGTSYTLTGLKTDREYVISIQAYSSEKNIATSDAKEISAATVPLYGKNPAVEAGADGHSFTVTEKKFAAGDGITTFSQIKYTVDHVAQMAENTKSVEGLEEGVYQVRIRSGRIIDGVYFLSAWSKGTEVTLEAPLSSALLVDAEAESEVEALLSFRNAATPLYEIAANAAEPIAASPMPIILDAGLVDEAVADADEESFADAADELAEDAVNSGEDIFTDDFLASLI